MDFNVFLGGTVVGKDWRDEVETLLISEGYGAFNPIVEEWTEKARAEEDLAKGVCNVHLYVITHSQVRPYSIAEAMFSSTIPEKNTIFLVLSDGMAKDTLASYVATMKLYNRRSDYGKIIKKSELNATVSSMMNEIHDDYINFQTDYISKKDNEYIDYIVNHRSNLRKAFNVLSDKNLWFNETEMYELRNRILFHDLVKYNKRTFEGYRRYFYPDATEEKEDIDKYSDRHVQSERHHPEYHGESPMTRVDMGELACDYMAMSYFYNNSAYDYFVSNKRDENSTAFDDAFMREVFLAMEDRSVGDE